MQDLPSTTQNGKYTHAELDAFNRHRDEFRKSVKRLGSWTICDQLSERGERRIDSHTAFHGATRIISYIIANNTSMRFLERTELRGGLRRFLLNVDLITAMYLPHDMEWLSLFVNASQSSELHLIGHYNGTPAPPLEELLRQSRSMPRVAQQPLENLLVLARQCKTGHVHRQEETVTLHGVTYARWVFCEPYFPRPQYCNVWCETPAATVVYIENVFLDVGDRHEMQTAAHTLFCADGVVVIDNTCNYAAPAANFVRVTPTHMPVIFRSCQTDMCENICATNPDQARPKPLPSDNVYTSIVSS